MSNYALKRASSGRRCHPPYLRGNLNPLWSCVLPLADHSSTPSTAESTSTINELRFYAAPPHECSYLPDRDATTLFVDPEATIDTKTYSQLSAVGFRRSGRFIYRPHCGECTACIPVRVLVQHYSPKRRQRRIWKLNQDLAAIHQQPLFREEQYALYERYIDTRHIDGDMFPASEEQYQSFLIEGRPEASFIEFRDASKHLIAVAVIDTLQDGLSSIYTYFDPDEDKRSPGGFASNGASNMRDSWHSLSVSRILDQ